MPFNDDSQCSNTDFSSISPSCRHALKLQIFSWVVLLSDSKCTINITQRSELSIPLGCKGYNLISANWKECQLCQREIWMPLIGRLAWVSLSLPTPDEEEQRPTTPLHFPMAQSVKNLPAKQESQVQSLGRQDPLEKGMATHSSILAWRIPWTEELGRLQSVGSQRVGHNWMTNTFTHFNLGTLKCLPFFMVVIWKILLTFRS